MDAQIIIAGMLGLFLGSGAALKRSGPYIFFFITTPILSAITLTLFMDGLDIPGFDMQFDRYLPMVMKNQTELIMWLGKGLVAGLVLQWVAKGLMNPPEKRRIRTQSVIDQNTPMTRRKYLKTLGLPKTAGPREITLAWTRLSREASSQKWSPRVLWHKPKLTPKERLDQVNEAYAWLKANPRKDGMHRAGKPTAPRPGAAAKPAR